MGILLIFNYGELMATTNSGKASKVKALGGQAETVPQDGLGMTKYFEGFRPNIYRDTSTKGGSKRTIGYGFNIDDPAIARQVPAPILTGQRAMTKPEADNIFINLYRTAIKDAVSYVGYDTFQKLTPKQQAILIDMSYNMGASTLGGFENMRAALQKGDMPGAVREMKDSNWYTQTGRRGKHHVENFLALPPVPASSQVTK